ncbi:hypothetical protein [Streptomyces sp. MAR4 CNX-425]|uniref:hypothetical protein n=1 Tax=Streptomyces sp. MAR4 CNX-425 TaxID=3406343 RepID=UPI003B50F4AC
MDDALAPKRLAAGVVPRPQPRELRARLQQLRERADAIMNLTYRDFANTPHVPPFVWVGDGCSVAAGYVPCSGLFCPGCVGHGFGCRSFGVKYGLRLGGARVTKSWIDGRFRGEMGRICGGRYNYRLSHLACLSAAQVYCGAVQFGGDSAFF